MKLVIGLVLLLACASVACGGGDENDSDNAPAETTPGEVDVSDSPEDSSSDQTEGFTQEALDTVKREAEAANAEYGWAIACLFEGDFTSDGWTLDEVIEPLGLSAAFTEPGVGTIGIADGGDGYVSIYDSSRVANPVPAYLVKVEMQDRVCYVPGTDP